MKPSFAVALAIMALAGACAVAPTAPQAAIGATGVGAPVPAVDGPVLAAGAGDPKARSEAIRLPDRIVLPATYRLILLDGHLTLVRETDSQALSAGPTTLRIVMGELARGELAYQPALLPQELAAEVASDRQRAARTADALEAVMRRTRELSEQVRELEAQRRRLAELLAAPPTPTAASGAPPPKPKAGADPVPAE